MLGTIEGSWTRGQRIRWLDVTCDWVDRSLSKLRELVIVREVWRAAVHGVTKSWTWLNNWTNKYTNIYAYMCVCVCVCVCSSRNRETKSIIKSTSLQAFGLFRDNNSGMNNLCSVLLTWKLKHCVFIAFKDTPQSYPLKSKESVHIHSKKKNEQKFCNYFFPKHTFLNLTILPGIFLI